MQHMEYSDLLKNLANSTYGILSIKTANPVIEALLNKSYETDNIVGFYDDNNCNHIVYKIFKVDYQSQEQVSHDLVKARNGAAYCAFSRWDALGFNKRHSKSPYKSKAFINVYREVCPMDSCYLLVNMEI